MPDVDPIQPANAIERVVGAIEMLAMSDAPLRLSEIAQQLNVPKSAVHRILTSLADRGWVEQGQNETYALTLRMPLLGQRLLSRLTRNDLRQPILDHLADRTRELVRLTALRQDALVWIGSASRRRSGLVYEADMTEPVVPFATANGKAWLATLPDERAIRIALHAGLGARPDLPRAVQTVPALCSELELTRARGYGLAMEEAEEGVAAVAVVIRAQTGTSSHGAIGPDAPVHGTIDPDAPVHGTMSVAAPISRLGPDRINAILPGLRQAAQQMTLIWAD